MVRVCRQFAVSDALAYALERTGDVQGALDVLLDHLSTAILAMTRTHENPSSSSNFSAGSPILFYLFLVFVSDLI